LKKQEERTAKSSVWWEMPRNFSGVGPPEFSPDLVTDQTSAHDPCEAMCGGMTLPEALKLRESDPEDIQAFIQSMGSMSACWLSKRGPCFRLRE